MSRIAVPFAVLLAAAPLFTSGLVSAQSTIKQPGARDRYAFEAEPHLVLSPLDPPDGLGDGGIGAGFRGTVEIVPRGFVTSINNSVGISFGLDWVRYANSYWRGGCSDRALAPNNIWVCTEVGGNRSSNYFLLPVVLQWNFWLTRSWSVFGEPGLVPYVSHGDFHFFHPAIYAGGRYKFNESVALTMRIGYPTFSIGASFFL